MTKIGTAAHLVKTSERTKRSVYSLMLELMIDYPQCEIDQLAPLRYGDTTSVELLPID